MDKPDESRLWKYLELPQVFRQRAGEIDITCKQHLRVCEKLASHLTRQKPKTPKEFEQNEYLKDFVLKTAEMNEKTVDLLDYLRGVVQEVCDDAKALKEGARMNATIRDQGEKIRNILGELDKVEKLIHGKTIL